MKPVTNFRLGIDLMGADILPVSIFEAVLSLSQEFFTHTSILFFATDGVIEAILQQFSMQLQALPSLEFCPCADVVEMDDRVVHSIKTKKQSTLILGIQAVKEGKTDAFLSCGNTGALVTGSYLHLGPFSSSFKPALLTLFPSKKGEVIVLDVGATTTASPSQMVQHALLGTAYAFVVQGIEKPKAALLNIGSESEKGDEVLRESWKALSCQEQAPFLFVGNKEPQDVFAGDADLFVTSGLMGNIFLKTAEATASFIIDSIKSKISNIEAELEQASRQGAVVLGVAGLVIKCHGRASAGSIQAAIFQARRLFVQDSLKQIEKFLAV